MKQNGFTLIELLIVVAIIGILFAIAIPNFIAFNDRAHNRCDKVSVLQPDGKLNVFYYKGGVTYHHNCVVAGNNTFCGTVTVEKLDACPQVAEQDTWDKH